MAEDDHQVIRKLEKIHQNLSRDHTILNHEISDPLEERKELISSDIENETSNFTDKTLNLNFNISGINNRMRDKTAAELGLRKRKDVVLKTLLRKIRSCIRNDFILYSKNFKRKSDMHIENIQRRLKNFISNCMEEEPTDSFWDTLGIFIWTEQIEGTLYQLNSHQHKMELVKKSKRWGKHYTSLIFQSYQICLIIQEWLKLLGTISRFRIKIFWAVMNALVFKYFLKRSKFNHNWLIYNKSLINFHQKIFRMKIP